MRTNFAAPAHGRLGWRRMLQGLFIAAALVILAAPMVVQFAQRDAPRRVENRPPTEQPAMPTSLAGLPAWTAGIDAWLKDHFGFRNSYVDALDQIHYWAFGAFTSPQILMGREGRVFLASHAAGEGYRNSLVLTSCGAAVPQARREDIARGLGMVLERTDAASPATRALAILVPSSAALYPQHLPGWLEQQCRRAPPLLDGIVAAMPEALRPRVLNLRPVLAGMDSATPAIPRTHFHWLGAGPRRSAQWIAEEALGRLPAFPLPTRVMRRRSDITGFFPGLRLEAEVTLADEERAGVVVCTGPSCIDAAVGPEATRLLDDVRRYDSPAPDGRLLLLTDSFGAYVASGFTPYFRQVVQVSLNNLPRMPAGDRARLREALIARYRPDTLLFLVHDYAATYYWDILLRDLLPAPP